MPLVRADYSVMREEMKPGDIIAFSGKGNFSELIKTVTRSAVSHVGIVFQSKAYDPDSTNPQDRHVVDVMESTTLYEHPTTGKKVAGVQRNRLSLRLRYYEGELWWLPLSDEAREQLNVAEFTKFLLRNEGIPYDMPQAVKSALDAMDGTAILKMLTYNQEDFSAFFCSELATAALDQGGVINNINSSEVTPIDLCRFNLYKPEYYQLKGADKVITSHNTIDPEGFGYE